MIIQEPGFITPQVLFLGSRNICMYLVMGEQHAIVGGGVAWEVSRLESQMDHFRVDRGKIRYLVVSHAHHDHCGAVPYIMKKYPHIQIVASAYAAHIMNKPQAIELMRSVNRQTLNELKRPHSVDDISLDFQQIPVTHPVGDGDHLDLGGLTLRFFQTPGHSRCSLAVYIPELGMFFPADSVPFPDEERQELTVSANHDYDDYLTSLEKLEPLAIRMVAYEHGGVLTGKDAGSIIPRSLEATRKQRERIRNRFEELQDLGLLIDEIAGKYHALPLFQPVPFDTLRAIIGRMVRSALGLL